MASDAAAGSANPGGSPTVRRVLVVDDQRTFTEAMQVACDAQDDLRCVGVAFDAGGCLEAVAELEPDVVLMDVQLPDADGFDVAGEILSGPREVDVLVLTGAANATTLSRAVEVGVTGLLLKDQPLDEILDAVRLPAAAHPPLDEATLAEVVASARPRAQPPEVQALTDREQTVLELLGAGRVPKQIARELDISLNTARGHVKAILAKLDCHSALEAVITAQRLQLLPNGGPPADQQSSAPAASDA